MIKKVFIQILLLFVISLFSVSQADACGSGSYHKQYCGTETTYCPPDATGPGDCYPIPVPCVTAFSQVNVSCSWSNGSCRYHVTDPGQACQGDSCTALDGGADGYWIDCQVGGGGGDDDCDPKDRDCCSCAEETCTPTCPAGTTPTNYGEPAVTTASCDRQNGGCNRFGQCMRIPTTINCYPDNPPPTVTTSAMLISNGTMPTGCTFNAPNVFGPYNYATVSTTFTDVQGRNDIVSLANWFARTDVTPPDITREDSVLNTNAWTVDNKRSYGLMVKKSAGVWNDLYFSTGGNTWKKVGTIGAGLRATMRDTEGKIFARISNVYVVNADTPPGSMRLEYRIEYGNKNKTDGTESSPPDGQYILYGSGNDVRGSVLTGGTYFRKYVFKATASNYYSDFTQPIVDLFEASIHGSLPNGVNLAWRITDETAGVSRVMGDALRDTAGTIDRLAPTPATMNYPFKTSTSSLLTNNLFNLTYPTKQNDVTRNEVVDLKNNFGGSINFTIGTFDNACNFNTSFYNQILGTNWITSRAGYVYSDAGYTNIIPSLTASTTFDSETYWNVPTPFIQNQADISSEVYISPYGIIDDLVQNARLQNGLVVRKDNVNNKKDYWYEELKRRAIVMAGTDSSKYEIHQYTEPLTISGNVYPTTCASNTKYCVIKTTEDIVINQVTCNSSVVFISDKDIEINPDIVNSGVHGCIFLAKNNVVVKDGTFKSSNSDIPKYDLVSGMLIADNKVLIDESQDTATIVADYDWLGDGKDGSITLSAQRNINTQIIATGRTLCADGINYNVASISESGLVTTTTIGAGCFKAGDEVIIMNMAGTRTDYAGVGKYEFKRVSSYSGTNLYFTDSVINTYGNGSTNTNIGTSSANQRVIVQRVPNYNTVTINSGGILTADAWNGRKGGLLIFRASGGVVLNGTGLIDMNAKGYRGGPRNFNYTFYGAQAWNGDSGESICGIWPPYSNNADGSVNWALLSLYDGYCGGGRGQRISSGPSYSPIGLGSVIGGAGGGGGGAGGWAIEGGGGAGAGYGSGGVGGCQAGSNGCNTRGESGTAIKSGNGGVARRFYNNDNYQVGGGGGLYGEQKLTKIYLGSGGGAGGGWGTAINDDDPFYSGIGGKGGGIIYIAGSSITVGASAQIRTNGEQGGGGVSAQRFRASAGGGGSGGSIFLVVDNINTGRIYASGAPNWSSGGGGGNGRIALYYASSQVLTSTPAAYKEVFTPLKNVSMKDGVKISGSMIAFGTDADTAVENLRTLGLRYSAQYPIVAIHYLNRYSELAKHVFGGSFDAYKKEVGFKPL